MLVFKTEGLIPLDAFTMFGLNAKPNSENPIGFFGTGLKYAVAITLRLGGTFRLMRGTEEFEFYTSDKDFRGKEFQSVRMRKRTALGKWGRSTQLPFTLELGKNWEAWMAVRELESNTRDECGVSCVIDEQNFNSYFHPSVTRIIIECPEMEQSYTDGTIFLDRPDGDMIHTHGGVDVYSGESQFIYMNGIRVFTPVRPTLFTYNITRPLELTEDRTPKWMFLVNNLVLRSLQSMTDKGDLEALFSIPDAKFWETGLDFDEQSSVPTIAFRSALSDVVNHGGGAFSRAATFYRGLGVVDMSATVDVSMSVQSWVDMCNGRQVSEAQRAEIIEALECDHDLDKIGVVS